MKYNITSTNWNEKIRYFKVEKDHKNKEFMSRMMNFVLHKHFIPEGFFIVDPSIGVPESASQIIKSFKPLFQLNDNQYDVWIKFNEFIANLDTGQTNHVLDAKVMDLSRVAPMEFLGCEGQVIFDGLGLRHESPKLVSLNEDYIKNKIESESKEFRDILTVICICQLLFFEATEVEIMEEEDGEMITIHWNKPESHEYFVEILLAVFVAHNVRIEMIPSIIKALKLPKIENLKPALSKLDWEQTSLFLFYYCQYLDDNEENDQKAVNYGLSKVMVNKFNL